MAAHLLLLLVVTLWLAAIDPARAQLNPLGRFGRCVDVPLDTDHSLPEGRVWYLQYRCDNPDHHVHTCQAQYEKTVGDRFASLLYYYNKGRMVNNPQAIKYHKVGEGEYYRGIAVDGEAVRVYMKVLHYDPVMKYRIVYYCTDDQKANPAIFNVNISTLDQEPCDVAEVLRDASARLMDGGPLLPCADGSTPPLMRVQQSVQHCEPLKVNTA